MQFENLTGKTITDVNVLDDIPYTIEDMQFEKMLVLNKK